MGQISPLDQLISSSAFNDCSVTVISSRIIITDVLLLCDCPSAPSPSLFCANVIAFFGTTPTSFTVVLCIFVVSSSAKCTFASVAWLGDTGHDVSPDQQDCQASHERRSYIAPPPLPRTNHSAACLNHRTTYLQPVMLPLKISVIYPLLLDVHTLVNASMHVQHIRVYTDYKCVFKPVGTNFCRLLLEPLCLSQPFFSPELKKLEFRLMSQ